ncbi:MAG: RtcB family protein [Parachlamydiaceae bacterium]|nr:RtcB family protein [Parachlamydiaceae bacterium]
MSKLEKIGPATYLLPKEGAMRVPGLIIANEQLISVEGIEKPLEQVRNVATLPGIVGYSIAMPDMHWGYGFPIGGVAGMDIEEGVISPGGVGYDINCGVRLAIVPLPFDEMKKERRKEVLDLIFRFVPSGVGHGHLKDKKSLSDSDYRQLLEQGAEWSVSKGFGFKDDLVHTESHGKIAGASYQSVSKEALARGRDQLGSIGSGNHFVEIGKIQKVFLPEIASQWGVLEGLTYVLIHSGSRGFGHQVCQDTLNQFIRQGYATGLPDRQLVAAPIHSDAGRHYFSAMAAAANFAFNNRQQILHAVRQAFQKVFHLSPEDIRLIYDVCHNIAKFETHLVDGVHRKLCVHRKGATRAYGPDADELAPLFKKTGQPVLVPGDMGRSSHLMVGLGNSLTFCSSCHGAGREQSRVQSMKTWSGVNPFEYMKEQGVTVLASSRKTVAEEMPSAYKDVDQVVESVEEAGLANRVAKLIPSLVVKG